MPRILERIKAEISFYQALLAHRQTPRIAKWCIYGGLAYLASPIDLIPDFIPILGQFDDLLLVGALLWLAQALTPSQVLLECRGQTPDRENNTETTGPD